MIEFEPPDELDEKEEARRQRIANMTDKWPKLAALITKKTWSEIYALKLDGSDH